MTLTVHIDLRTKINVNKFLNLKIYVENFKLTQHTIDCTRKMTGLPAERITATACS